MEFVLANEIDPRSRSSGTDSHTVRKWVSLWETFKCRSVNSTHFHQSTTLSGDISISDGLYHVESFSTSVAPEREMCCSKLQGRMNNQEQLNGSSLCLDIVSLQPYWTMQRSSQKNQEERRRQDDKVKEHL